MTHLVSNGGSGIVPFTQAVIMSPAVSPLTLDRTDARNLDMLTYFGLQNDSQSDILALSADTINDFTGHIGAGGWGPIVDGFYYQELPGAAFAAGRYHKNLNIITGKVSDEAHDFTPTVLPYIIDGNSDIRDMSYDTKALMTSFFALEGFNLSSSVVDQVWDLYPTINNTDLYYTIFGKYDRILSEVLLDCYSYYMSKAYSTAYNWYFDVAPGYHAQENPYLFAGGTGTGGSSSLPINATLSNYMKTYLVNFVKGDINGTPTIPTWAAFGTAGQALELGSTNVGMISDPANNDRCAFWETNTQ